MGCQCPCSLSTDNAGPRGCACVNSVGHVTCPVWQHTPHVAHAGCPECIKPTCARRQDFCRHHSYQARAWRFSRLSMERHRTSFAYWVLTVLLLCQVSQIYGQSYTRRPSNTRIVLGGNVTLPCAWSVDNVAIVWQKGATILFVGPIRQQGANSSYSLVNGSDLRITGATIVNSGSFTCTASGETAVSATLTVLVPPGRPTISPDTSGFLPTEGQTLRLTCSSRGGNPPPQIQWWRDGRQLSSGPTNPAAPAGETTSNQLTLTLSWTDHNATYSCRVWNEVNRDDPLTVNTSLNVRYSPRISFVPFDPYVVEVGQLVQVTCKVDAYPLNSLTYRWERNGIAMLQKSDTIRFPSIEKDGGGNLTCFARNGVGSEKNRSLSLTVQYGPEIVDPIERIVVNESERVNLVCGSVAKPRVDRVEWRTSRGNVRYESTWLISSVQRDDTDNYTCSVANQLTPSGSTPVRRSAQHTVQVIVQYAPGLATIETSPSNSVGDRVVLKCVLTQPGVPEGSYEWQKVGSTEIRAGPQYIIPAAQISDSGRYQCRGRNMLGAGPWGSILIYINEPVRMLSRLPESQNVSISRQNFELRCQARGRPRPIITWEKNGVVIDPKGNGSYEVTDDPVEAIDVYSFLVTSKLKFKGSLRTDNKMLTTDSANYSCSAGNVSQTVHLLVQYLPVVTVTPHKIAQTETVTFQCLAQANPEPQFRWFFKENELNSAGRYRIQSGVLGGKNWNFESRLTVTDVQSSDLGQYTCNSSNQLGSNSSDGLIVVKSYPDPCSNLEVLDVTWMSIFLQWQPGFDGGEEQSFVVSYKNGDNQQTTEVRTPSVNLTGLSQSVSYELRVAGKNSLGTGEPSDPITQKTKSYAMTSPEGVKFDSVSNTVWFEEPEGGYFAQISVMVAGRPGWQIAEERASVKGASAKINVANVEKVRVAFCLEDQPSVCSAPVEAQNVQPKPEDTEDLPTGGVIAIACLCAIIIIILFIVLFCVIRRRKREKAARDYELETQANRRSQPITAPVNRVQMPKHGYDNLEFVSNQTSPPGHMTGQQMPPGIMRNGYQDQTDMNKSFDSADSRTYGDDISKENEAYRPGSVPYHPTESNDHNLSGLESGYSTPEPTKPKKVIYEVIV